MTTRHLKMNQPTSENPPLDRWVQRVTTTALLALAAGLLGTGIAFYLM